MITTSRTLKLSALAILSLASIRQGLAQQHDLSLLAGATVPAAQVTAGSLLSVSGGATVSGQLNYGYLLKEAPPGQLYLEALVARVAHAGMNIDPAASVDVGVSQFYAAGGLRYRLGARWRVSPYFAGGFGFGWFDKPDVTVNGAVLVRVENGFKPAFNGGAGVEFRATRLLGLKAEVRDFIIAASDGLKRNHLVFAAGFSLRF